MATSKKDASLAGKQLAGKSATKAQKSVAASDLAQARRRTTVKRLRVGARIRVPYGADTREATVIDIRDGLVFVSVDPDSDAPIDTFYHSGELVVTARAEGSGRVDK